MSEPEDFLSRWSRRKHEAKAEPSAEPKREQPGDADTGEQNAQQASVQPVDPNSGDAKPDTVFDLSKLPSLDSIGPATDIRVFLQPGVPEALSRAALRRAWAADPAIRDFIGLSENSWDFTASDGMHGFGALDPADAKRLFAQLLGEMRSEGEQATVDSRSSDDDGLEPAPDEAQDASLNRVVTPEGVSQAPEATDAMLQDSNPAPEFAATQHEDARVPQPLPAIRRGHGRALPQ